MRARKIAFVPILAPFPNVPGHVIQAESVRLFCAYGVRVRFGIVGIPCHGIYGIAARIVEIEARTSGGQ